MNEDLNQPQSDEDFYQLWKVNKLSQLQHMRAICMLAAGYPPKEVAEKLGITQRALQKWFNDTKFNENLTYAIGISIKGALAEAAAFALDGIKILKSIAEAPDTPTKYKLTAVKIIFDILQKGEGFTANEKQLNQLNQHNLTIELFNKQRELDIAKEYIRYQKELKDINEELHLLPYNHPLYEPQPSPEIQKYKNIWKMLRRGEPFPDDEAELKECYNNWLQIREEK